MSDVNGSHFRHRSSLSCCNRVRTSSPSSSSPSTYTWDVPYIPTEHQESHSVSEPFTSDGQKWKFHVNTFQVRQHGVVQSFVAVYLEWLFSEEPTFEYSTRFELSIVNLSNEDLFYCQRCAHRFVPIRDSGFTLFVPIDEILDVDIGPSCENGISITVQLQKGTEFEQRKSLSLQFGTYGFSILALFAVAVQYLYHIPYLRAVVEETPVSDTDSYDEDESRDSRSLIRALRKVFHDISKKISEHVDLMILFKAYGSQLSDLGKVFDFWEFLHYLIFRLEMYWENKEESPFRILFSGRCEQGFHKMNTKRLQQFEVFQLDTLMSDGFYDALNNACSFENHLPMKSNGCVQNIKRSTQITSLPSVLRCTLKRFKYDPIQKRDIKLLHFFDFPTHLTLDHSSFQCLSSDSHHHHEISRENHYMLTAVIAHEGNSLNTGYYITYIRLDDDNWWKLSESSSLMSKDQVMESCARSACFLSYSRLSDWHWVMSTPR